MAGHFSSLLSAAPDPADRIPFAVLTGFLGSGKTTLLNRLLAQPDLRGTAVIVNEFGEIGIDHDLIEQSSEDTVLLSNGCLCCTVRGDLVQALGALAERPMGTGMPLQQVLIETSGLADPAPILHTLMAEPAVRARFFLAGIACTVDAVLGMGTLDRHPEALKQVAVADHLFLTKTDLQAQGQDTLRERLSAIAPQAALHEEPAGHAQVLQDLMALRAGAELEAQAAPFYRFAAAVAQAPSGQHRDGISSFVIVREQPLPRDRIAAWLDMLAAMRGDDLLRVKGIVCVAEEPDRPLVIHGVQHLFHPPRHLASWPSSDHRTRIVFITRGLDAQALEETLNVLAFHRPRPTPRAPAPPTSETP